MTLQEEQFEDLCTRFNLRFQRGLIVGAARIDYYLPEMGLYVELKTWECERLHEQLQTITGKSCMVLVGPDSIAAFERLLDLVRYTG